MSIARVFPRRTRATPRDALAFVGDVPLFLPAGISEVHVSVTFSWDLPEARRLVGAWERIAPVKVGGPACGTRGEDFEPGVYLAPGYTITSRGCPNRCWFCEAWKRDGTVRELPIRAGWNVLDDNLLACSERHIAAVLDMLRTTGHRPEFTGGLDPARLTQDIAAEVVRLHPESLFLAYDTPDDWPHVERAAGNLIAAGYPTAGHRLRCYVLIGYPGDTIPDARARLTRTLALGVFPAAMLWRGPTLRKADEWTAFQREWFRPAIINGKAPDAGRKE